MLATTSKKKKMRERELGEEMKGGVGNVMIKRVIGYPGQMMPKRKKIDSGWFGPLGDRTVTLASYYSSLLSSNVGAIANKI